MASGVRALPCLQVGVKLLRDRFIVAHRRDNVLMNLDSAGSYGACGAQS
jgi:hypothetical protein